MRISYVVIQTNEMIPETLEVKLNMNETLYIPVLILLYCENSLDRTFVLNNVLFDRISDSF